MPISVGAPRLLLRRLREVMAERESAQARLDKVVVLIASNMVAEVCSLYLRRRDASLELFATEGLNREAVHNTHLKPGEGLVGLISEHGEPMQFADAQTHPAFSYRPETGEEIYHSFLGVPILRGGHTIGVLTVQSADLDRALEVLRNAKEAIGYLDLRGSTDIAKVSAIGVGMRSHAGVAAQMFSALAEKGINIEAISTSEIKISVLIDAAYAELAVRTLHTLFGLDSR